MKKYIVGFIAGIAIVTAISCASFSESVTPATIDKQAVQYVEDAGVVEPNSYDGYPNLDKANRLAKDVSKAYEINVLELKHMIEDNDLNYAMLNETVARNLRQAIQREEAIFAPDGILPLMLGCFGVGVPAGLLGLARKRPQDFTQQDMELALQDVKQEITEKDKSILELIKGFQEVLNSCDESMAKIHKKTLAVAQSSDTKETVAKIKATL